jgi:hypothetical protein
MDQDLIDEVRRLGKIYTEHGLQIFRLACWESWIAPGDTRSQSALFRACTPSGRNEQRPDGNSCGCLVEVRYPQYPTGPRVAWTDEWTSAIQADQRVPESMGEIFPEQLVAFAEWQQRMRDRFTGVAERTTPMAQVLS